MHMRYTLNVFTIEMSVFSHLGRFIKLRLQKKYLRKFRQVGIVYKNSIFLRKYAGIYEYMINLSGYKGELQCIINRMIAIIISTFTYGQLILKLL